MKPVFVGIKGVDANVTDQVCDKESATDPQQDCSEFDGRRGDRSKGPCLTQG
tara:strand:+ start:55 stop:210 length:156 start_codon:yes stop_codon:yes gene_type:complete